MIGRLRGALLDKDTQEIVVDVGGVGYQVQIPLSTFYRLGSPGSDVELHVHTHVREDALQLFGFLTRVERRMFERLIAVSGVGPRLALGILSGIETEELVGALRSGDLTRLTRIPGVGKKTAERLVVELKDKMPAAADEDVLTAEPEAVAPKDDVISALANLGYSRNEAERGVERALRAGASQRLEDLLRATLRIVSGGRGD